MISKLLFITSRYFLPLTRSALERIRPNCETLVVSYDNFDHIGQVYAQHAEAFDACFVSGAGAKQAIEYSCPNISKPLFFFQVSSDGMHRDILRLAVESQSLDFSRIAMDFLMPLGMGHSVTDYLAMDDFPSLLIRTHDSMKQLHTGNLCWIEELILREIRELWQEGRIDLVFCQYSSIIPQLEEMGIPYRCPFIGDEHLGRLIDEVLIRIELQKLHDNHPAIIQIFPRHSDGEKEVRIQELDRNIREFIRANLLDCVVQSNQDCCILITSMKILRFLTGDFESCQISAWLDAHLDFPATVAYGVGTTVSHAMNNVQIASREAKLLGKPFVVDSNGNLIGPLAAGSPMVISPRSLPDVSEIARRCNLSTMTIQKLMTIVRNTGSDKITTQNLAKYFDTTIRNANRIILNLCKGHVATPVYTQPSHSRGRPIQVYALNFEIPRH